jgi:Cu-Zn family superoxide dismutase
MQRIMHMSMACALVFICLLPLLARVAYADTAAATMLLATDKGPGEAVGVVTFADSADGLSITTDLQGLTPGRHGFHVHENPDCSPVAKGGKITPAGAAGGHYDPDTKVKHLGPQGGGHKGDLPVLIVAADGSSRTTMKVQGVTATEFRNRALLIHAGGDNYSDIPEVLGGGGAGIACGVIR